MRDAGKLLCLYVDAPNAKIIFISNHYAPGEASVVTRLLGAGAFVEKEQAVKLLIPTIQRVLDEAKPV